MTETQGIMVSANNWPRDLDLDIPAADWSSISAPDREAFFAGMLEFLSHREGVKITRTDEAPRLVSGASAPLLIPRTRIFIRFGDSFRDWYKKLIKTAAMFAIVGSQGRYAAFVGLSIDLTFAIFEKLSRLDEVDAKIVTAILELTKSKDNTCKPSTAEIAKRLSEIDLDLEARISSLKTRGILREQENGWSVAF